MLYLCCTNAADYAMLYAMLYLCCITCCTETLSVYSPHGHSCSNYAMLYLCCTNAAIMLQLGQQD